MQKAPARQARFERAWADEGQFYDNGVGS